MTDEPRSDFPAQPGIRGPEAEGAISIALEHLDDLFEGRPADPLRGRFEDRSGVEQLLESIEVSEQPLHIEIDVLDDASQQTSNDEVASALAGYATAQLARVASGKARIRRLGRKELAFGLAFLASCLLASSLLAALDVGAEWFRTFVVEGLIIVGWIALWHPVDMLFFERLPLIREQRLLERIRNAQVSLRIRRSDNA